MKIYYLIVRIRFINIQFEFRFRLSVSEPVAFSANSFNPKTDSLHASMRPIIMLAQFFSLFPVSGVNSPDSSYLR